MPINMDEIIERAVEQAFSKALDQVIQSKVEELFRKAFQDGSPLSRKLEEKIEQGFQRFVDEGISMGERETWIQGGIQEVSHR